MTDDELELFELVGDLCRPGMITSERIRHMQSNPALLSRKALTLFKDLITQAEGEVGFESAFQAAFSSGMLLGLILDYELEAAAPIAAFNELVTNPDDGKTDELIYDYLVLADGQLPPADAAAYIASAASVKPLTRRLERLVVLAERWPSDVIDAIQEYLAAYTATEMIEVLRKWPQLQSKGTERVLRAIQERDGDEGRFQIEIRLTAAREVHGLQQHKFSAVVARCGIDLCRHILATQYSDEQISRFRVLSNFDSEIEVGSVVAKAFEDKWPALAMAVLASRLNDGLMILDTALVATEPGSPQRAGVLVSWADLVAAGFDQTPVRSRLDEAIRALEEALTCVVPHRDRLSILTNLGSLYSRRYDYSLDLHDLGMAVQLARDCVRVSPSLPPSEDNTDRQARYLTNLGVGLLKSFHAAPSFLDISEAVTVLTDAVNIVSPATSENARAIRKSSLASALYERATAPFAGEAPAEIDDASRLQMLGRAARLSSEVAAMTHVLPDVVASCLHTLSKVQRWLGDSSAALATLREGYEVARFRGPRIQAVIAAAWGESAARQGDWQEAAEAYLCAMDAQRRLFGMQVRLVDQRQVLDYAYVDPAEAATALRRADRTEAAVVALEQGRALLLSAKLDREHAELDTLARVGHGDLAAQFKLTAKRFGVAVAAPPPKDVAASEISTASIERLGGQLAELSGLIREVPGHEHFGLLPRIEDVTKAAQGTPLVYLVAAAEAGHAFVVRADGDIEPISLAGLHREAVDAWLDRYLAIADASSWLQGLDDLGQWLWDEAMGAIASEIASEGAMVMVPCGGLGLFPLHAAWTRDDTMPTGRRYLLDDAAITYTANARALNKARVLAKSCRTGTLVIDEPLPASAPRLPFSAAESDAAARFGTDAVTLRHGSATRTAVIEALATKGIAHFSCHGRADLSEPLESSLLLANDERLSLRDLDTGDLNGIRLMVLSACETARIGGRNENEVVAFPAALLGVGVPAAVASLWSVPAASTAELMIRFYEGCGDADASYGDALRRAQIEVRDATAAQKISYLAAWAPSLANLYIDKPEDSRPHARIGHWGGFAYYGA